MQGGPAALSRRGGGVHGPAAGAAFMVFAAGAAGATEDPAGFIGMQVQGLNPRRRRRSA